MNTFLSGQSRVSSMVWINQKHLSSVLTLISLALLLVVNAFFAQDQPPTPTLSPTASPSPTPARTPSPTPLPGAQNFHQWGSITVFNGLPSDSVRAIAQTPDGVMWFGTDNGLARFDGRRVQRFSPGGTDSDQITALKVTGNGELLVGTRAGAFVYRGDNFRAIAGTQDLGITTVLLNEIEIYLGTDSGEVLRVTRSESGTFTAVGVTAEPPRSDGGAVAGITSLAKAHGKLMAGTSGRGVFDLSSNAFAELPSRPRPTYVNALAGDASGDLWLGTDAARGASGIFRIDDGSRAVRIAAPTSKVLALEAGDSGLWAGTERFGLFHIVDGKLKKTYTFENTSGGLRSNTIYTLFTDRESVLWIGTNRGVSRFDRLGPEQQTVSDIPNSNFIRTLYRSRDGRTFAGSNRGLFVKQGDRWTPVEAYANKPIFALDEDRSGTLLVGTVQTDPAALPNIGAVWRERKDPDGSTWIAGQHGVFRTNGDQTERIVAVEDVRDIYLDGEEFWAATTTRGLLHGRKDERFGWLVSSVGFEQGLPSEKVFAILPTGDGLLIATNRGVVTYKPGTIAPKIIATRVLSQRLHDLREIASTIALDHPQNSILVEVAGQSSRTFPEEFQYAFVLKNAKGETLDQRLANDPQYNPVDLKPGDYAIEAIAFNRDLLPSEPLTIKFSVARAPFPWTATALAVLLAIAVAGLVWAVYEHRRIRQRNRELAAARLDLANEAERERSRIARDLHDQTLADLRTLMIRSDKGELSGKQFRDEIESVSTDIRRICEDLSPSVLENVGLVAALEFLLAQTIDNHIFSADEGVEERVVYPINVQLQIYRIAQEVLTNIRRHSNADLVEMKITAADQTRLLLTISDNGNVFEPDGNRGNGRGISNIVSRANLIGARVGWAARPEGGNVFSLSIEPQ